MTQASAVTEEMRRAIGAEAPPLVYEIEKGAIRKFARAIGDTNPLHQDEEYARKSHYGGIIAPPTFVCYLRHPAIAERITGFDSPLKRLLNGGSEVEYFQPIRAGDVISVTPKIANIRQRESKLGPMLFFIVEVAYKNQKGELVAMGRQTLLRY